MWKPLPSRRVLKTLRGSPKRTTFASGGFGSLQMVSEPDNGQCGSEDSESRRRVDCEIPHWLERRMKHLLYECENFSLVDAF